MWETWVWSLGWEDPLEKERQPTPVFWPGEFHGLSPWGCKKFNRTEQLSLRASLIALLVKNLPAIWETPDSIPGSGRSAGEGISYPLQYSWASLVAQLVKNLPAMWETWVWSLGREDPLKMGKATHSSILVWRIKADVAFFQTGWKLFCHIPCSLIRKYPHCFWWYRF